MYRLGVVENPKSGDVQAMLGIDWVTVVIPLTVEPRIRLGVVSGKLREEAVSGSMYHRRTATKYSNGIVVYGGVGDQSQIIPISGALLTEMWNNGYDILAWLGDVLAAGARASRIDLTCDFPDGGELARKLVAEWIMNDRKVSRRKTTVIKSASVEGETCTLYEGSRQSDMFSRIYDKNAESKGREQTTRFELEIKGDTTIAISRELAKAHTANKKEGIRTALLSMLKTYGQNCETISGSKQWRDTWAIARVSDVDIEVIRKVTKTEEWIERSVIPALIKDIRLKGGEYGSYYEWIERECRKAIKALDGA